MPVYADVGSTGRTSVMAFGCFASFILWLTVASVAFGSMVPIALGLILMAAVMVRRASPDWPLY